MIEDPYTWKGTRHVLVRFTDGPNKHFEGTFEKYQEWVEDEGEVEFVEPWN